MEKEEINQQELRVETPGGTIVAKVSPDPDYPGIWLYNESVSGQPGAVLEYSPTAYGDTKSCLQMRVYGLEDPENDPIAVYQMGEDVRGRIHPKRLDALVKFQRNILVSGTSQKEIGEVLSHLMRYIPEKERVVVIESQPYLTVPDTLEAFIVSHESVVNTKTGEKETKSNLVKTALRMRPDRIVLDEVDGPEAFDFMNAVNTGHPGSMAGIKAESPEEALKKLEKEICSTFSVSIKTIRESIVTGVDIIIQVNDDGCHAYGLYALSNTGEYKLRKYPEEKLGKIGGMDEQK